jgi:serine/threonine protein kinase
MEALLTADPTVVGPYKLVGRLGSGGMGQVYLGVSPTAEQVAVKVIRSSLLDDGDFRDRFALEVLNLKTVYGARVARFEGAGLDDDPPWLAVEYVQGPTLRQHVERSGPLDTALTAVLGAQLADGLGKIHEAGVLHRDLKPQNILLGRDGPKVIDFGLAMLLDRDHQLTEPGQAVGTLAYMSPEQTRGDTDLKESVDVYALGATLAYAVTGRQLYPGQGGLGLANRINDPGVSPDLGGVPDALVALLGLMLAYEPTARPGVRIVHDQLIGIAQTGERSIASLRRQLIKETFTAPAPIVVQAEFEDPRADPEDAADEPAPAVADPMPPSATTPPVDVGWLAEKLLAEYAQDARF